MGNMLKEERLAMYAEVQSEIKDEFGVELSVEEIGNIFISQFKIMVYGFVKGLITTIPVFGKFYPYNKHRFDDSIQTNREQQKALISEGRLEDAMEVYIDNVKKIKRTKKQELQQEILTADEVFSYNEHIDIPDAINILKNIK